MAKIRQEINLIDHLITSTSAGNTTAKEFSLVNPTNYNGTVTYYFEIIASNTDSLNRQVTCSYGVPAITITAGTTNLTLFRSASFTADDFVFPTGDNLPQITVNQTTSNGQLTCKSARIVIIQEATTLTNTETQIEIGNYNLARTAEAATILTNPKYWKYDASKWDGTKTFYAEAVYDSGDMDTITVALYEATDILAPSWSSVATIVSAGTTTVPTRTRVSFTPTDGRWYTIFSLNGSMDNHDIYRAGIVVQQIASDGNGVTNGNYDIAGTGNAEGRSSAAGQSFSVASGVSLTGVRLKLSKIASPTDNLVVDLVDSLTGSALATGSVAGGSLSTSEIWYDITFGSPYSLSASTTYYIRLTRDGSASGVNYYRWSQTSSNVYANGAGQSRTTDGTTWNAQSGDAAFVLLYSANGVTKLEPQYLLANTLFAAGTGLQTFLTDWDSTEWDDGSGSIAYYFQAEAANGSTSDVTLQEADGGGAVTGSTLTNIDNAQISSAMTMPADQNLDVIANANAGDVAAARILVTYVFAAVAEEGVVGPGHEYIIITS